MKMRQTQAEFERAFESQVELEAERRARLRHEASQRSRVRRHERVRQTQKVRFSVLVASLAATVVVTTWLMFTVLGLILG